MVLVFPNKRLRHDFLFHRDRCRPELHTEHSLDLDEFLLLHHPPSDDGVDLGDDKALGKLLRATSVG